MIRKKSSRGILVGLLAVALAFLLHSLKITESWEWKSWDWRLRLFQEPSRASDEIAIFLIDQYSLDVYEEQQGLSWPWPRQIYSAVIDYLVAGGARAVVFDLLFSEPSRSGVEDDLDFAAAIERAGNVFLTFSLSREEGLEEPPLGLLERFSLEKQSLPAEPVIEVKSASLPVEVLLTGARGAGNVLFTPDGDSIFRRLLLLFSCQDLVLPSLPLALAKFIKGEQGMPRIPLDETGRMIIRYYGPEGTYRSYSIAAIINSWAQLEEGMTPQIPPREFADKIVFIGGNAPGLLDLRPTPFSPVNTGVEIQVTVVDNILSEDFVSRPPRALWLSLAVLFALITAVGISLLRKIWQMIFFLLLCAALPFGAAWAAFSFGYWLEFVTPEISVLLGFIGAALLNYSVEGRQRRFIKSVFRHYLSPDVIERIIRNPSLLRLGGEKREITSFFSDVAGFTAISEALAPEELVNLLNEYLSEMTEIILEEGGTLDKYEGDAIIAFWNAPLDQPDHALRSCRAALRCQRRLEELRQDFRQRYGHSVAMRIGLNSGPAVVGNMGSSRRFDYTAMGDTVNLAARLEGACKTYGISILVGEETFNRIKEEFVAREVDRIRVVGKKKPVAVFEITGERGGVGDAELEKLRIFDLAREAYRRRDWEGARRLFERVEDDPLARLYEDRCRGLSQSPPPEDWDGVFDLKVK